MKLIFNAAAQRYEFVCSFFEKDIAKRSGFWWDPKKKTWWTPKEATAKRLAKFADESCPFYEEEAPDFDAAILEASRAIDADIYIPAPEGLEYMPFQRAGIAYALDRQNTLFGDEPGLGKTIQAIGLINADPSIERVIVVCPASMKLTWVRELEKWLVRPMFVGLAGKWFPSQLNVVVINYDQLLKHQRVLRSLEFDLFVCDESHKIKNSETIRAKQVAGIRAQRLVFLTGTPIVNRPAELWALISQLWPDEFDDKQAYEKRYCSASPNTVRGRERLIELQKRLRATGMVRRLKSQVLTDLPAKRRQVIDLQGGGEAVQQEIAAANEFMEGLFQLRLRVELAKASESQETYDVAVEELKKAMSAAMGAISRLRHQTALAKVPLVIEHVREVMENGEKAVLFAHHRDVIDAYLTAMGKKAVKLVGDMNIMERDASVQRFIKDPSCQLFIGSIQAAGVGLTLTVASHVIFAELDWVPGNVTQAEDRCHRIGQRDSVLVQHLVLEESIDSYMAKAIVSKQEVIDKALDHERVEMESDPIVPLREKPAATSNASRAAVQRDSLGLNRDQGEAVHAGLKALAESRVDNRVDGAIARALAAHSQLTPKEAALGRFIVRRYRAELPADIATAALGRVRATAGAAA